VEPWFTLIGRATGVGKSSIARELAINWILLELLAQSACSLRSFKMANFK
jgi:2-phosphoglycerate kinase